MVLDATMAAGTAVPTPPPFQDLVWGWNNETKVERTHCNYYRMHVDSLKAQNGFVLQCRSASKDKFKLMVFSGTTGELLYSDDSTKLKDKTASVVTMYFTNFDVYDLAEGASASGTSFLGGAAGTNKDSASTTAVTTTATTTPVLFRRIEAVKAARKPAHEGFYLVAVYGDNFIGRSQYSLIAVPSHNQSKEVESLQEADKSLLAAQEKIQALQKRYEEVKAAYDGVLDDISREQSSLEALILARDIHYRYAFSVSVWVCVWLKEGWQVVLCGFRASFQPGHGGSWVVEQSGE